MASAEGLVCFARPLGGWGNFVILRHRWQGQTYYFLYAHLETISVGIGTRVDQGEELGLMGTTGNSTGIHLHFALRSTIYPGKGYWNNLRGYYDPAAFISQNKGNN